MVGEGVLHECLLDPSVEQVLVINRKPGGVSHPKLKEIIHTDFSNLSPISDQLEHYNACFFCLGVSSVGMKESDYYRLTFTLTLHVAQTLLGLNSDMTFCYVSGVGTDSTGAGNSMWARVKGKTENALINLPFKGAYMFRAGYIQPIKGLKNTKKYYAFIARVYPVWQMLFPGYVCTLQEVGQAMIKAVINGYEKPVLNVKDIIRLARS